MKYLFYVFIVLLAFNSSAQDRGEEKLGAWYMYFGSHSISDRLSVVSGVQIRDYEFLTNLQHRFYHTGLNYNNNSKVTSGFGYGYLYADFSFEDTIGEMPYNEHRIYEQIQLKSKFWEFTCNSRFQLEQRFMDYGYKSRTKLRSRYRLQVSLPISELLFINVYNELFLNLQDNLFDQNRLYAALGIKITSDYKFQIGYLRHSYSSIGFNRLQLGVSIKTDLRKRNLNLVLN